MDAKDIKLNPDGDLEIARGDFPIDESDQVHINHILLSNKGYWFQNPLLGVGIIDEINGATPKQALRQSIRRQLIYDDYTVQNVDISDDYIIDINAVRKI